MWFVKSWAVAIKYLIITGKRQFLTCYRHLLRRADPQENRFHTRPVLHGRHPLISFLQASLPTFHPFLYGHSWDPLVGLSTFQACPTGPPWGLGAPCVPPSLVLFRKPCGFLGATLGQ